MKIAKANPDIPLLNHHRDSRDAPDFTPLNDYPKALYKLVKNPERIHALAPGETFALKRIKSLKVK